MYPLLKTGGLADVVGALPPALIERGADVRVLLPGFPAVVAGLTDLAAGRATGPPFRRGRGVTLERGTLPSNGLVVYVIRAGTLYDRPGNPYLNDEHRAVRRQRAALRPAGLGRRRKSRGSSIRRGRRRSSTLTTGTRASRPPI